MKKTYYQPSMTVVKLQHQGLLMITSGLRGISDGDVGYGGASINNEGGEVRTRESSGVWDDEW